MKIKFGSYRFFEVDIKYILFLSILDLMFDLMYGYDFILVVFNKFVNGCGIGFMNFIIIIIFFIRGCIIIFYLEMFFDFVIKNFF